MRRRPARLAIATAAIFVAAGLGWAAAAGLNIVGPKTRIQPTGRKLDPVGKLTKLGNFPTGGALTPDGRFLWALSTGRGRNDIRIVRVRPRRRCGAPAAGGRSAKGRARRCARRARRGIGQVVQRIRMPGLSGGIAFSPDGRRAYVSGLPDSPFADEHVSSRIPGRQGDVISVFKLRSRSGRAARDGVIPVPPPSSAPPAQDFPPGTAQQAWPRDLAVSPDGKTLLAALNLADSAAIVDTRTREVRYVDVGHYPYGAAITGNGRYGLVTGETEGTVSVIDLASAQLVKTIQVGPHLSHPEGMAVDPKRPLAFVAIANDDQIGVIDTNKLTVSRSLSLERRRGAGTTPTQVTVTRDGCDLLSADSGEDSVAVFALRRAARCDPGRGGGRRRVRRFQLVGRLPVGSYPTAVAARSVRGKLAWISARGLGVGPNPHGPDPNSPNDSDDFINSFQYLPSIVRGSSGILGFPSDRRIRRLTPRADRQIHPVNAQGPPAHTPIRADGPIQHVFYVVKENRTYDQVLGDVGRGDGDPHLTLFGRRITPNTHALARRFPLLDHVYADSEASIDGHYWTAAGAVSDYVVKNWPQNYSGRGRPYDFGSYEVSAPPKGYIFGRALHEGIPFYNYGEALAGLSPVPDKDRTPQETAENAEVLSPANSDIALNGGCYDSDVAIFNPVGVDSIDVYDSSVPSGAPPTSHSRFDCFNARFQAQLATGSVPPFNYIVLPLDHTQGVSPGKRTPDADVADNDWALGQIVDAISHSTIWGSSLILVMEDDSQDGADHVDAHRIPALAISPYTERGAVVHDRYDQLSFLRTAEIVIGMKPLNLAEALAVPLYDAMTPDPSNSAPYDAIAPKVDVTATNPNTAANRRASAGLPLNMLDQVPQRRLDAILWRYRHGETAIPPPPGPNASAEDDVRRDQSGDEALGHPSAIAKRLRRIASSSSPGCPDHTVRAGGPRC
jgi:DNA-binding beta-propeller fold protein YncE